MIIYLYLIFYILKEAGAPNVAIIILYYILKYSFNAPAFYAK